MTGRLGVVLAAATLAAATSAFLSGSVAGADPIETTFQYTGGAQPFEVPAGVCSVTVVASGASGGDGVDFDDEFANPGGAGGRATATLAVTPGEVLQVNVGGRGQDGDEENDLLGLGGFNGGAAAGASGDDPGAGGGGASDVRRGAYGLADRLVVAGGGGGAGGGNDDEEGANGGGGAGGGTTGVDGEQGLDGTDPGPAQGGKGGTQAAGGAGGAGFEASANGVAGEAGSGGAGGSSDEGDSGGGGGGGWFGGGGGGGGDDGSIYEDGGGGGGGAGFTSDGTGLETGVNPDANGTVVISYDPAAVTCPVVLPVRFTG